MSHLPRHRCRGLIEANERGGNIADQIIIFRGIDAAASLKRGAKMRPSSATA